MVNAIEINGTVLTFEIEKRRVKYPRLEFVTGELRLIVPQEYKIPSDSDKIVQKYRKWISSKNSEIQEAIKSANSYGVNLEQKDKKELQSVIDKAIRKIARRLNVKPLAVKIRRMKTKWGSCSKEGNLTFNSLLSNLPDNLIRYVVCHEMIHLKVRRHDGEFWRIMSEIYPDHDQYEKQLFSYWFLIPGSHGNNNLDK